MAVPSTLGALIRPFQPFVDRLFPRGALLLSTLTLATYALGFVRNKVQANAFGLSSELDAFLFAFFIPEIVFDVIAASGLAAPFVPILVRLRRDDPVAATRFAQTATTTIVLALAAVAVVIAVFATPIAEAFAPGFDPATRALYADLLRVAALIQVLFAISLGLREVLVAERRFLAFQLAPILYYLGIIGGTVLLAGRLGIWAAAVGAVVGALLHVMAPLVGVLRLGFPIRPRLAVRTPAFAEFLRLMAPKMVSTPIEPLLFQQFNSLATGFAAGSVSALSFGKDFQGAPVNVIGVAFSLAIFPVLSQAFVERDRSTFVRLLRRNVITVGGLSILAAIALVGLAPLFVRFLTGGRFDADAARLTTVAISAFALSVPFDALQYPLARAIYATRNTSLQVLASLAGLAVGIVLASALAPTLQLLAIPLAYTGATATKVVLMALAVGYRVRRMPPAAVTTS
jgi:putative peptidoglycan lipid II flippase